jgi:hemoglobin
MTPASDEPDKIPSLWERLGGTEGADALIEAFYERVLADPELAPFFEDASMDRLRKMQREFFSVALGGPLEYSGMPLVHAHHGRGIEPVHLRRFVGHLMATLEDMELSDEDRDTIYDRIHRQANDVLGRSGHFTG